MDDLPSTLTGEDRFTHYVVPEIEVMLRVARSITRDPVEAEDLVQDALVRAFRSIDRFDGRHPRAWLLTIVRNTHVNRNRRRRPSLLDDPDATETAAGDQELRSAEDDVVAPTFEAEVEASLRSLSDDARQVIELVDLAGLSYAEAAEALQVPVGTVMSRLHRARSKIRDQLRRSGFAPRRFR